MSQTNILLLGSGGRESALAWKIAQSPLTGKLFIAPGNGGTCLYGTNVNLSPLDFDAIAKFVVDNNIDLVVPGNEEPPVEGIYDYFQREDTPNVLVACPSKAGAALEAARTWLSNSCHATTSRQHAIKVSTLHKLKKPKHTLARSKHHTSSKLMAWLPVRAY
jgi:phosphoribosylamine-glycine ligase